MSQFTINNTQFTEAARLLLLGNSYMRYELNGQKGPAAPDPRGRAAQFLDLFASRCEGHEAVYRRCVEAAALLSQATQPLFRGDVDGNETQALMGAVRGGNSRDRHALRALVHRMRAFGALPGTADQVEGYRDFLAKNLEEGSGKSLERVRYVGAARFFEGAARFHGVEKKPEIIPGAIIAFETWLNLVAGDMNDTLWNSAVELYQMTVGFSRDAQEDAMYVEDDVTATRDTSFQDGKGGKAIVTNDTSYLLERLRVFQRAGKLSPAGASLEDLVQFFENLERVRRGDFSPVRLEPRAVTLVEPIAVSKSEREVALEEALRNLKSLIGTQSLAPLTNDKEGFKQFKRLALDFGIQLKRALADNGRNLHQTRDDFFQEALFNAEENFTRLSQGKTLLESQAQTVAGIVRNFIADLFNGDSFYLNGRESWDDYLNRMTELTKKEHGKVADTRKVPDLPVGVPSIEPLGADPQIPIVVEAEPTKPGRIKR